MSSTLRSTLAYAALFIAVVLIVTDCASGKKRFCPGVVREHVYTPPYEETVCSNDGKDCHTVSHAAEYHLLVECQKPAHVAKVKVNMAHYAVIRNEQPVVVGEQVGRWSQIAYFNWIESTSDY